MTNNNEPLRLFAVLTSSGTLLHEVEEGAFLLQPTEEEARYLAENSDQENYRIVPFREDTVLDAEVLPDTTSKTAIVLVAPTKKQADDAAFYLDEIQAYLGPVRIEHQTRMSSDDLLDRIGSALLRLPGKPDQPTVWRWTTDYVERCAEIGADPHDPTTLDNYLAANGIGDDEDEE